MATSSTIVSGLVSGLDTSTIISQLMQLEAQPQTSLKNRVTSEQKVVTALQGINTKLAALFTSAGALGKVSGWGAMTATSSYDKVTVAAGSAAQPGQLGFTVKSLAASYQARYTATGSATATGTFTANTQYTVTFNDTTRSSFTFSTGDGSLNSVASALNAAGSGVDASLVPVADANGALTYGLAVTDEKSGATSGFTITPVTAGGTAFGGGVVATRTGQDASILMDGQTTALKSATNTFTSLMPGVDVTLQSDAVLGTAVNVSVGHDTKSLSDSVKSMVDAVNSILADIDSATAYNASTKTGGTLSGDSAIRDLRSKLLSAVSSGVATTSSQLTMAGVGIQTDRDGKLVFDAAKFAAAYAADPAETQAMFAGGSVTDPVTKNPTTIATGFATSIATVADRASNSTSGSLTLAIQGHNSSIKTMNNSIADWDVRLAARQAALQRQYAALEVSLGKLQDQSTWLAGQIKSLPSSSSGN